MERPKGSARDLTVLAVPAYFGGMGIEYVVGKRRAQRTGPSTGDYERRDTLASLTMGAISLVTPLVLPRLLRPFALGKGRLGTALAATAAAAAAVTAVADRADRDAGPVSGGGDDGSAGTPARRMARIGGITAVVAGGISVCATWAAHTAPDRLWSRRVLPDLGTGAVATALAILGWDVIYYWNHRISHESRVLWASHVVHHSSERYNLSTALRQPVTDAFGAYLPYGLLCLFGIAPELITTARGVNLLYQFWIHTEAIDRIGAPEAVLNSPSHHRVHHGSNRRYLDRNHGSILIVWDKLFGTFEPESEPVVYGLTTNIGTFRPDTIATHEYADILRDVGRSTSWGERLSAVLRGPGWAKAHWAQPASAAV